MAELGMRHFWNPANHIKQCSVDPVVDYTVSLINRIVKFNPLVPSRPLIELFAALSMGS